MRADKRSFSFTWMRGGEKSKSDLNSGQQNPNPSWFMTNASSSSSSSGVSSMSESSSIASTSTSASSETGSLSKSDSKSRLRRLGNSFTRFGTKYSIIEDVDEANTEKEAENIPIPPPVEFENQMNMELESVPEPKKEPAHPVQFDEDGNFIGRVGKTGGNSRRKSVSGGVDGTSSSFGRKINRTVQEVKASIGSFSQKFRRSTRRRYRMGQNSPLADVTPTRRILGRTPTKLYSPFGIGLDSPGGAKTPKRLERPSTPRLTRVSTQT